MNYNYPFLAGYLESILKTLADDRDYVSIKTSDGRREYINSRIKEAYESMAKNSN